MKSICKYDLKLEDRLQQIEMPEGAFVCHVGHQEGYLKLWAIVEPDNNEVTRTFVVHGTGHRIKPPEQYIGTTQLGPFVWHVFEVEI